MPADRKKLSRALEFLLVYAVAEVIATALFARFCGVPLACLLYIVPAVLVLVIHRWRYPTLRTVWRDGAARFLSGDFTIQSMLHADPKFMAPLMEVQLRWAVLVLLLVPGAISHIIALALIVPPTRKLCIGYMLRHIVSSPLPSETEDTLNAR